MKILYGFEFYFFAFGFCYTVFAAQKNTFVFSNDGFFGFFAAFWAYVVCVWGQTNVECWFAVVFFGNNDCASTSFGWFLACHYL